MSEENQPRVVKPNPNKVLQDLNFNYVGYWPQWFKFSLYAAMALFICILGFFLLIKGQMNRLKTAEAQEITLKQTFTKTAEKVAGLDAYKQQLTTLRSQLNNLLEQLPKDTEVPALLEDISRLGTNSGLNIGTIDLQKEKVNDSFIELPIKIQAEGSYHEVAGFVSGISSMKRIITLHDYRLSKSTKKDGNVIKFDVLAKTYRYEGDKANGK